MDPVHPVSTLVSSPYIHFPASFTLPLSWLSLPPPHIFQEETRTRCLSQSRWFNFVGWSLASLISPNHGWGLGFSGLSFPYPYNGFILVRGSGRWFARTCPFCFLEVRTAHFPLDPRLHLRVFIFGHSRNQARGIFFSAPPPFFLFRWPQWLTHL